MQEDQARGRTTPDRSKEPMAGETRQTTGLDYVAISATIMLGVVASMDLIYGDGSVALVAAGAVAGYVTRLYHG